MAEAEKSETALEEAKITPVAAVKKLAEADFELSESMQMFMTAIPPAGTTKEDLLNPVFWSHVAKRLEPMTEIRVMPKDGAWYGTYLVVYSDHVQVQVQELTHHKLGEIKSGGADLYYVKYLSPAPTIKFCVYRKEDNERISEGHQTEQAAVIWMREHAK